jgi:hypothetical protein
LVEPPQQSTFMLRPLWPADVSRDDVIEQAFARVIRRLLLERPALTAGDLLNAMKAFEGRGAGPRRRRSRDAAA